MWNNRSRTCGHSKSAVDMATFEIIYHMGYFNTQQPGGHFRAATFNTGQFQHTQLGIFQDWTDGYILTSWIYFNVHILFSFCDY
jgi:hypothetical protein